MNYALRDLLSGNKRTWSVLAFFALWVCGIFDLISGIRPPGIFHGYAFKLAALVTVVGGLGYLIFRVGKDKKTQEKTHQVEEEASVFEPRREAELREIAAKDPHFATHCYLCVHFNEHLQHCKRDLTKDISLQRVKKIKINNREYCLYWEKK